MPRTWLESLQAANTNPATTSTAALLHGDRLSLLEQRYRQHTAILPNLLCFRAGVLGINQHVLDVNGTPFDTGAARD